MHELLGAQRLGVEVAGSPEHGDEQFGLEADGEIARVVDGDAQSRKVDEQLLTGLVVLAHGDVEGLTPVAIELTELAVFVPVGVLLSVFDPQQRLGHCLLGELRLHLREVGLRASSWCRLHRAEEPGLECVIVAQLLGQRPRHETRIAGATDVVGHRRVRHRERQRNLAQTQLVVEAQSKNVTDLSHGCMGTGHRQLL